MLRHFEISQLRQDFELQLTGRAGAPLLARNIEPILPRNFADKIDITRPAPPPLEIDRSHHFAVGIAMFDFQRAADLFGGVTNQFFNQVRHFFEIGVSPINFEHGEFRIVFPGNAFVPKIPV